MRHKDLKESPRLGHYIEWTRYYLRMAEIISVDMEKFSVNLRFLDTPGVRENVRLTFPYASDTSQGIFYIPQIGDICITAKGKDERIFILGYLPKWIPGLKDLQEQEGKAFPWFTLSGGEIFIRSKEGSYLWFERYGEGFGRVAIGDIKNNRFEVQQDNRKIFGRAGLFHLITSGGSLEIGEAREMHENALDTLYTSIDGKGMGRVRLFIPEYFSQEEGGEEETSWHKDNPIFKLEGGTVLNSEGTAEENTDGNELCLRLTLKKGGQIAGQGIKIEVDKEGQLELTGQGSLHLKFDANGNVELEAKKVTISANQVQLGGESGLKRVVRVGDGVQGQTEVGGAGAYPPTPHVHTITIANVKIPVTQGSKIVKAVG